MLDDSSSSAQMRIPMTLSNSLILGPRVDDESPVGNQGIVAYYGHAGFFASTN